MRLALRWTMAATLVLLAGTARPQACEPVVAPGVEEGGRQELNVRVGTATIKLRLYRAAPREWRLHVFDMRDLRRIRVSAGDYRSPSFSLEELAETRGNEGIYSSAGSTGSLQVPAPVGLLKVNGQLRNAANPTSRILDGLVCVRQDGIAELRSEMTEQGRRIPQTNRGWADCRHAVQAGPMLVEGGKSLVLTRSPTVVPRVFIALDARRNIVLGHASDSSSFDLACALSAGGLGLHQALMLQSHHLGGIVFGKRSGVPAETWGDGTGTVASALELRPLRTR